MSDIGLEIAVIGDKDLVSGLRLAGVRRYYVVPENDSPPKEEVRTSFLNFLEDPKVGVIAIQETYTEFVRDLIEKQRDNKILTPVIIEVPSKRGEHTEDVNKYYKDYVRKFTGFDIEI
ncbi:MAG: V-type ATP synthase subunit F [Dehalococcoidales bacterium]